MDDPEKPKFAWSRTWAPLRQLCVLDDEETKTSRGFNLKQRPILEFVTGSVYEGHWSSVGMHGEGHYVFPHQSGFRGSFEDGQFKEGEYYYPMGQGVDGYKTHNFVRFADGLIFAENFKYCLRPDRRYLSTISDGFRPPGKERVTGAKVDRPIPSGCYDTGDGFFDPYLKCVVSALDNSTVIRIPTQTEENWIIKNCRKGWDEPIGYRPDLYEQWTTGLIVGDMDDVSMTPSMRNDTAMHINESSSLYDAENFYQKHEEIGTFIQKFKERRQNK